MRQRYRELGTFVLVAIAVAAIDLVSKHVALTSLGTDSVGFGPLSERVRLYLVSNDGTAFGRSLGAATWHLNIVSTLLAIVLTAHICRALARIDVSAPGTLGLIAGGGAGNLASLLTRPEGVPDFIAVTHSGGQELVMNLADVAAYVGLALLLRSMLMVIVRARTHGWRGVTS